MKKNKIKKTRKKNGLGFRLVLPFMALYVAIQMFIIGITSDDSSMLETFSIVAISLFSFALILFLCAFMGKKYKWANIVCIIFGALTFYSAGVLTLVGGVYGLRALKEKDTQLEESNESTSNVNIEKNKMTLSDYLKDHPVDYDNKPVVSQVLDENNTSNLVLENEKGVSIELNQLYVNVYKNKLYLLGQLVKVDGEDNDDLLVLSMDYDQDAFNVETDDSISNAILEEYKKVVNEKEEEEEGEFIKPKMSLKGKKSIMISLIVSYSLFLLAGILLASIPSLGNIISGMGICEDFAGEAYAKTIGVMWIALVPTIGYYFATISPYELSKKNRLIVAGLTMGLLVFMNVIFFVIINSVRIEDIIPIKDFYEGEDSWFIPLTMVFSSLGIAICYALTLFRISPNKIKNKKPIQEDDGIFAMIKHILMMAFYYILVLIKKILTAKEKQPDIFILVSSILFTWFAYFVSFIFAIIIIFVMITAIVLLFTGVIKLSNDYTLSSNEVVYTITNEYGYEVELRHIPGAPSDRFQDANHNTYVTSDGGKTFHKE